MATFSSPSQTSTTSPNAPSPPWLAPLEPKAGRFSLLKKGLPAASKPCAPRLIRLSCRNSNAFSLLPLQRRPSPTLLTPVPCSPSPYRPPPPVVDAVRDAPPPLVSRRSPSRCLAPPALALLPALLPLSCTLTTFRPSPPALARNRAAPELMATSLALRAQLAFTRPLRPRWCPWD